MHYRVLATFIFLYCFNPVAPQAGTQPPPQGHCNETMNPFASLMHFMKNPTATIPKNAPFFVFYELPPASGGSLPRIWPEHETWITEGLPTVRLSWKSSPTPNSDVGLESYTFTSRSQGRDGSLFSLIGWESILKSTGGVPFIDDWKLIGGNLSSKNNHESTLPFRNSTKGFDLFFRNAPTGLLIIVRGLELIPDGTLNPDLLRFEEALVELKKMINNQIAAIANYHYLKRYSEPRNESGALIPAPLPIERWFSTKIRYAPQ